MRILEGKSIADEILTRVKGDILKMSRAPGFGAILVGNDPASKMYIDLKKKAAQKCGILFCDYILPENASKIQVLEIVEFLNNDSDIDGVLIQLPLPEHLDKAKILNAIDPKKDVDGLTARNQQCFIEGEDCFICPFPRAIVKLLHASESELLGKKGVVLANSADFGSVMTMMLSSEGMDVSCVLFGDKERQKSKIYEADVVVSAVGRSGYVTAEMIKDGAIVIDGGIEKQGDIVCGDVAFSEFTNRDVAITPVPGGVGPVTVACLIENVLIAKMRNEKKENKDVGNV